MDRQFLVLSTFCFLFGFAYTMYALGARTYRNSPMNLKKRVGDLACLVGRRWRSASVTLSRIMRRQRKLADENTLIDPCPFSPIRCISDNAVLSLALLLLQQPPNDLEA